MPVEAGSVVGGGLDRVVRAFVLYIRGKHERRDCHVCSLFDIYTSTESPTSSKLLEY